MKYDLNDEQWASITANSPMVIVNASAGSGKTRCLVAKVRHLLDNGAEPSSILALTFTNKAAKEMKNRLKLHCPDIGGMQMSTIHSMAVQIMKKFIHHTPLKLPFSIYDDNDQLSVIKTVMRSRGFSDDPYEVLGCISRAKAEQSEDRLMVDTAVIYKRYQEILLKNNACDFDDLLTYAHSCLKNQACRDYYTNLWKHILVDEFQDTSKIQFDIILSIYDPKRTKTFFAAGDLSQSIYGWRQAHPENMQTLITDHKADLRLLSYNYRSCPEIIAHANNYQQFGKPMVPKSGMGGKVSVTAFSSQEDEANKIADALLKMGNYESTAVLYRMNTRSLLFERAFAQRRIPYKVVGELPFYRRKVAKDLLSYLKASCNPSDMESLNRIVNVPKRGFGDSKKEKLLTEGWGYLHETAENMPEIRKFIDVIDSIRGKRPMEAMKEVLDRTGYRDMITKDNDRYMVDAMLDVASGFDSAEELILASTFLEKDTGNGVKLMTAHSSKGLEFDRVFVVGVEQDVWPHKLSENPEEEERLYFVAITRAKFWLNLSYAQSKLYRGHPMQTFSSTLFQKSYNLLKK